MVSAMTLLDPALAAYHGYRTDVLFTRTRSRSRWRHVAPSRWPTTALDGRERGPTHEAPTPPPDALLAGSGVHDLRLPAALWAAHPSSSCRGPPSSCVLEGTCLALLSPRPVPIPEGGLVGVPLIAATAVAVRRAGRPTVGVDRHVDHFLAAVGTRLTRHGPSPAAGVSDHGACRRASCRPHPTRSPSTSHR